MSKEDQKEHTTSELEGEHLESGKKLADGYGQSIEKEQDVQLLLHSPMGIRADMNITNWALDLWISPLSKKSADSRMRNFSNRDDHTSIFDSITFPGLAPETYQSCDYDPFHSVLHYDCGDVHLAALVDAPGYVLWYEGADSLVVDFKSDKQDGVIEQSDRFFSVRHPDRGLEFEFAAAAGEGEGVFQHQRHIDEGRSVYARIDLASGQALFIGGEILTEQPGAKMQELAGRSLDGVVEANEKIVRDATARADVTFRELPDWQFQYDLNKRVLFSAQDYGGGVTPGVFFFFFFFWAFFGGITLGGGGGAGGYPRRFVLCITCVGILTGQLRRRVWGRRVGRNI